MALIQTSVVSRSQRLLQRVYLKWLLWNPTWPGKEYPSYLRDSECRYRMHRRIRAFFWVLHEAHVQKVLGGKYTHFGFEEGIQRALDGCTVLQCNSVELQLHVDCVSPIKSSLHQLVPLLERPVSLPYCYSFFVYFMVFPSLALSSKFWAMQ